MATVYIVTSGDYSAYSIERVFLNKDKAQVYCNAMNKNKGSMYSYRCEEYETSDDTVFIPLTLISYQYRTCDDEATVYIIDKISYKNNYGEYFEEEFDDKFLGEELNEMSSKNNYNICGTKLAPKEYFEPQLIDYYKKYCYDRMAYCKSLLSEGYSVEQVNEMLNQSYKESDNE